MSYLPLNISIIIITRNRPSMVDRCLENLYKQNLNGTQIIIVDSSADKNTKEIILSKYPKTLYLSIPNGKNNRPFAKNKGIEHSTGEIVAFLDDDSIIQDGWKEACLDCYKIFPTNKIGGAGGMVIDTSVPIGIYGGHGIGKISFNGTRIANFHQTPGKIIEVEHVQGCNMSFRKDVLKKIDGFDLNYTGSNVLEETDLSVRVKKAGYKILFSPAMKVIHMPAPRENVFRETFTFKREFYITRNSTYFMLVNFGFIRTLSYMITNNTGVIAFFKNLRLKSFICIFISMAGKGMGFIVGLKQKLKKALNNKLPYQH